MIGDGKMPAPTTRQKIGKSGLPDIGSARRSEKQLHNTNTLKEAVVTAESEVRVQHKPQNVLAPATTQGRATEEDRQSVDGPRNQGLSIRERLRPACVRYPMPRVRMLDRASDGQGLQPMSPGTCTPDAGAEKWDVTDGTGSVGDAIDGACSPTVTTDSKMRQSRLTSPPPMTKRKHVQQEKVIWLSCRNNNFKTWLLEASQHKVCCCASLPGYHCRRLRRS